MVITTLTLAGKRYVVVPESQYKKLSLKKNGSAATRFPTTVRARQPRRLSQKEIDRLDVKASIKALADPYRISAEDAFKKLGI